MTTGVSERPLQIEHADLSLIGHREENEDRVAIADANGTVTLAVVDGMGGHADGARAAEVAMRAMLNEFWEMSRPLFDPEGFLHLTVGRAHEAVVALGQCLPPEIRPRATCALCLVQGSSAYWAHVGDSRIYQLRHGKVFERTRDHSHVELLLRAGRITERQAQGHPMRNYVERCIGADPVLPEMTLSGCCSPAPATCSMPFRRPVVGVSDEVLALISTSPRDHLREALVALASRPFPIPRRRGQYVGCGYPLARPVRKGGKEEGRK